MKSSLAIALGVLIGLFIGWWLCSGGCMPFMGASYSSPKEVNVVSDSTYTYHIGLNQKTIHLSKSLHETVAWTFDHDSTVDSVTAVFSPDTPFASHRFSFADSAAFSGLPVVSPGGRTYGYIVTVYPHGHAPVNVDPGIIIDM
jgi:hypothetical protein